MRVLQVELPLRVVSVANLREHWAAKARRTKDHRATVVLVLKSELRKPGGDPLVPPFLATLTRIIGPRGRALDDDNLRSAFKAVRDGVAQALGVDDGDASRLRFEYAERRGKEWAVEIRIEVKP